MATVSEILLRVTGDISSAETDLAKLQAELEAFNRANADAEVSLDSAAFKAELEKVKAELIALDRKDVNIDVDVTRGIDDKLNSVSEAARRMFGRFGAGLSIITKAGPIISGFGGILVALASSLASAALSTGALAISFGATLVPAGILAAGVIRDFKNHSGDAGTAANDLKKAAQDLGRTFDQALRPAADKVLSGLAKALPEIGGMIKTLAPDFSHLGGAVSDAIQRFTGFITSRQSVDFLSKATNTLADIVRGPGTDAFISFSKVLMNIADAALPVLRKAFGDLAGSMQHLAHSTGDIDALREHIRNGYNDLKQWIAVGNQVGRIIAGIFKAALPDGRSLVETLRKGAQTLADWINSASGQNAIQQFLAKVIPPAERFLELGGKILVAFLKWSEFTAPIMGPIFVALGKIVDGLSSLLDALDGLPGPIHTVVAALLLFGGGKIFSAIAGLVGKLTGSLLGALGNVAVAAGGRLVGAFGSLASSIGSRLLPLITRLAGPAGLILLADGLTHVFDSLSGGSWTESIQGFNNVRTSMDKLAESVKTGASQMQDAVTAAANGIAGSMLQDLVPAVKKATGSLVDALTSTGPKARNAAEGIAHAAVAAIRALTGDFKGAGHDLGEAFADAVGNKEPLSKNAGSALGRAVKLGLEDHREPINQEGQTHGDRYAGGVSGKDAAAHNAGFTIAKAAKDAAEGFRDGFTSEGDTHGNRYANALEATKGAAGAAARVIGGAARDAIGAIDFASVGSRVGSSIADGIRSAESALASAAAAVAHAVIAAYNAAIDSSPVHSPHGGGGPSGKVAGKLGSDLLSGLALNLAPQVVVVPVGAGGGGGSFTQNNSIVAAGGGSPDPRHLEALLAQLARTRGGFG